MQGVGMPSGGERVARMLQVKVKPGARVEELTQQADGSWLARVKAPPVDGKANEALVALIAAHFKLRKAQVTIRRGTSSRLKLVSISD
jgi:uncharacterized protein (TIGR00251 family)